MGARTTERSRNAGADSLERARRALADESLFEAERLAADALDRVAKQEDYRAMAHAAATLRSAREARVDAALDAGEVTILGEPPSSEALRRPGCWLLEPPLVGADGRRLREEAFSSETPALVIVREPATRAGQWPLVMIGPVTVRAYVAPPEEVDADWMLAASEMLGEAAIEQIADDVAPDVRITRLLERLQTLPDADVLHEALIEACLHAVEEAEDAEAEEQGERRRASGVRRAS